MQEDVDQFDVVLNADQSGIQKELYTARTLSFTGERTTIRTAQSVSSTTHSYTIMPTISMNGRIGKKLFVVLGEPGGVFPGNFDYKPTFLDLYCHTSHMMTKELMKTWFKNNIATEEWPEKVLLIVDSWPSWKDHAAMQALVPQGKLIEVRNIPGGATSLIQPLDVSFNHYFKVFIRKIDGHVMANRLEFKLAQRNNILQILEVVYNQFQHPLYQDFIRYAWHSSFFVDEKPEYQTPVEYCFPSDRVQSCHQEDCDHFSFIRCTYCEYYYCFDHFVENLHLHNPENEELIE